MNTLNKFLNTIPLGFAVRQALGYKLKKRVLICDYKCLMEIFTFSFTEVKTVQGRQNLTTVHLRFSIRGSLESNTGQQEKKVC